MKLAGAYINDDTYERLVGLALKSNRTLAGQCRHLFDKALKEDSAAANHAEHVKARIAKVISKANAKVPATSQP